MEYELRISGDLNVLVNNFSNADMLSISNGNFTPNASGKSEYIRIEIDAKESYTSTKYFAVRAKDEAGNVGAVSNIISILVANGYRMTVKGNVVHSYNLFNGEDESTEETGIEKEQNNKSIIIGVSSAVVGIALFMIVVICKKIAKANETVEGNILQRNYFFVICS